MILDSSVFPLSGGTANIAGFEWSEKTTDFTAVANKAYYCDTALGNILMTLPSSPVNGDEVAFLILGANKVRIITTAKVKGSLLATDYAKEIGQNYLLIIFEYIDSTTGWSWNTRYDSYIIDKYIGTGDPYAANTELLLKFEGSNGSSVFVDSSDRSHTITRVELFGFGQAYISTTNKKYGSSSFWGRGNYLTIPSSSSFGFGTGDFCIEFWVLFDEGISDSKCAVFTTSPTTVRMQGEFNVPRFYVPNTNISITDTVDYTTNWTHFAISRSSGVLRVFVNGVLKDTRSYTTDLGTANSMQIGKTDRDFVGYIDTFRITKGVARYTEAFNPETDTFLQF